jgi:hypothetical protein
MLLTTPEIQRLSLAIGALTAIAWKERQGVIPGGIIVPGMLVNALLLSPAWCLTVVILSLTTRTIYRRWLEQIGHQRRQPMYILGIISLLLSTPIAWLQIQVGLLPSGLDSITGGFLPGVMAFNLHRQGVRPVLGGVLAVTTITAVGVGLLVWIGTTLLDLDFNQLNQYDLHSDNLSLRAQLLQFLVALLAGGWLYRRTGLRPGGYMVSPIAAALLLEPISAALFVLGCLTIETGIRYLMQHTLIIGLQRYVAALLLSIGYVWGMELAFIQMGQQVLPFQGNRLLVIIALLSYANDAVLEGVWRVLPWMLLMLGVSLLTLIITQQLLTLFA